MVNVTEEEKQILREKIEARKQRERNQENEMQLPGTYVESRRMTVLEMLRMNMGHIILVGVVIAIMVTVVFALMNVEFPTHNLEKIYDRCIWSNSVYSEVGDDGSYILVDTNPYDIADYNENSADRLIIELNEKLKVPESVITKMAATRALDGMQTYDGKWFTITWTYHPDNGLEVIYEKK